MHRTGSNNVPMGRRRDFDDQIDFRGRPRDQGPPRKKKFLWRPLEERVILPGLPTTLPPGMSDEQVELFVTHLRIEEITKKLRSGNFIPPESDRSPSPEPQYGPDGMRSNTPQLRYKKRFEDERHRLIERATKLDPNFTPPPDYRKPGKVLEKVWIPATEYPQVNFIGLLIGPRGNTLKTMEQKSGAKIAIRGKGSVKEGRGKAEGGSAQGEEEPLHCIVTADSEDKINKAVELINKVIETAASTPEGMNDLKRSQLRELAAINGTLRDDENQTCLNCGAIKYECPERQNITNNIVCRICGGVGHVARDCNQRNQGSNNAGMDTEYARFMSETGGSGRAPQGGNSHYGPRR